MYKHVFNVPASWKNKEVNIVFEGSMTDTEVKINGKLPAPCTRALSIVSNIISQIN
jgi:hypothetical protein